MKISQCTVFVAIADTGSFTNAAKALAISQSAVSHSIAGLESSLGVALMTRDRGGVRLTEAGRRVLTHARALLLHAEQMRQAASVQPVPASASIRIGTSQSFAARLLPRLLTEYRARLPHVEISLREGTDRQITDWLRGYAVDIGIVTLPKENLTTIPLLRDEMFAVLPGGHPLAGSTELEVHELLDKHFIMPVGDSEPILRTVFRTVGREPVVRYRVQEVNALLAMVAEGHGVTVVPELALPAVLPEGLRVIPFTPRIHRHLGIGVRTVARNSPTVAAFVTAAQSLAQGRRSLTPAPRAVGW
ncbi:LysR family transcriptional regulator [Kitasatospora sp. NPDC002227]|uniref:LysR family transcriptional regulator n=1 Tax=Kitasatospora sp. NPDC002227 TaxID=3154773 RepID=UPI00332E6922